MIWNLPNITCIRLVRALYGTWGPYKTLKGLTMPLRAVLRVSRAL